MHNEETIELTDREMELLAALPREMETGDLFEARVVNALRDRGHLGSGPTRSSRSVSTILKIAAAVALFAGGVATGRYVTTADTPQTASTAARSTSATTHPSTQETIVAERELWL
ncbi:MAG: hypothetical protein ABIS03_09565 [Gemmatimonadaceae bacterium]